MLNYKPLGLRHRDRAFYNALPINIPLVSMPQRDWSVSQVHANGYAISTVTIHFLGGGNGGGAGTGTSKALIRLLKFLGRNWDGG